MTSNVYHGRISICFGFSEARLRELRLHSTPSNVGRSAPAGCNTRFDLYERRHARKDEEQHHSDDDGQEASQAVASEEGGPYGLGIRHPAIAIQTAVAAMRAHGMRTISVRIPWVIRATPGRICINNR